MTNICYAVLYGCLFIAAMPVNALSFVDSSPATEEEIQASWSDEQFEAYEDADPAPVTPKTLKHTFKYVFEIDGGQMKPQFVKLAKKLGFKSGVWMAGDVKLEYGTTVVGNTVDQVLSNFLKLTHQNLQVVIYANNRVAIEGNK